MINKQQLRDLITFVLKEYNLYTEEAVDLVHGTIIQESRGGTYIRQRVKNFDINKHALGIAQIEKDTFIWLKQIFVNRYPDILLLKFEELEYNLKYSILFCRLRYLVDPEPIPKNLVAQAEYYKRIYNTLKGKAKIEEYINNYTKWV